MKKSLEDDENDYNLGNGSELNESFSKTEFLNVVKNLKNGNEMIKNSPDIILDFLLKFKK